MSYSSQDFKDILNIFPKFELCYELITHNKVSDANIVMAIPEGKKCYIWFTNYKENDACFLIELNNKSIVNITQVNVGFRNNLSKNSVFYGTLFHNNNTSFVCIEDIYFYNNKCTKNLNFLNKLNLLRTIFNYDIIQTTFSNIPIVLGIPVMAENDDVLLKNVNNIPYKISSFKHRFFDNHYSKKIVTKHVNLSKYEHKHNNTNNKINNNKINNNKIKSNYGFKKEAIFKITADIEPDIYNLFILSNNQEEYYDVGFIPDYNTSVMMNKLFRNIKENINLDAIEESDDEDEFEDDRDDKYVYLDKSFNMLCEYNIKFKRWVPIRLAETTDKIISSSLLNSILTSQK